MSARVVDKSLLDVVMSVKNQVSMTAVFAHMEAPVVTGTEEHSIRYIRKYKAAVPKDYMVHGTRGHGRIQ